MESFNSIFILTLETGKPENDMITNPVKTTLPSGKSDLQNFALSWMADDPKLGLNEDPNTCYVDDVRDCLPLPPETDPCFKILDDEIFSQCHFVVDPIMYVTACQQDMCKTGPSQMGSCDSIAAYVRECARSGICIDWRRNGFCTMKW